VYANGIWLVVNTVIMVNIITVLDLCDWCL